ncbi:CsgE family curli-type amyloid fiber assembly protein [Flavobacterium frigidarium]|uniref:CsgE family curli-type amyloid fiber assembly protein n=1 Tax=Flavobacterium frigidarium TaxID=99286 RepID=UPI0030DA4ED0
MKSRKKKVAIKPVDGFSFKGVIVDETKTKIGKEFYDLYYYKYNEYNINSAKIVTIIEELSFGRNTKIMISIDNNVVYEFLARPDQEYIESMVQSSVYQTYQYLRQLENQLKSFTQY